MFSPAKPGAVVSWLIVESTRKNYVVVLYKMRGVFTILHSILLTDETIYLKFPYEKS